MTNHNPLPEITIKALFLGVVLSMILAGANAYLGLFAGMTVSASIPAAVISMGVLSLFKKSNILENNIVQTAASAGESLAAGVIFTIPALVLLGYWETFDYMEVAKIATVGGVIGVLFTIPLRRALIVVAKLKYPEGIATAEILRAGEEARQGSETDAAGGLKTIGIASLIGGGMKVCQQGFAMWHAEIVGGVWCRAIYLRNRVRSFPCAYFRWVYCWTKYWYPCFSWRFDFLGCGYSHLYSHQWL